MGRCWGPPCVYSKLEQWTQLVVSQFLPIASTRSRRVWRAGARTDHHVSINRPLSPILWVRRDVSHRNINRNRRIENRADRVADQSFRLEWRVVGLKLSLEIDQGDVSSRTPSPLPPGRMQDVTFIAAAAAEKGEWNAIRHKLSGVFVAAPIYLSQINFAKEKSTRRHGRSVVADDVKRYASAY